MPLDGHVRANEKRAPSARSMKPRELRELWRDVAAHGLSLCSRVQFG